MSCHGILDPPAPGPRPWFPAFTLPAPFWALLWVQQHAAGLSGHFFTSGINHMYEIASLLRTRGYYFRTNPLQAYGHWRRAKGLHKINRKHLSISITSPGL